MARGVDADTVEEYLDNMDEPFAGALRTVRDRIAEIVPEAEQVIRYRVPIFSVRGEGPDRALGHGEGMQPAADEPARRAALSGRARRGEITGATLHFAAGCAAQLRTLRTIVDYRLGELA